MSIPLLVTNKIQSLLKVVIIKTVSTACLLQNEQSCWKQKMLNMFVLLVGVAKKLESSMWLYRKKISRNTTVGSLGKMKYLYRSLSHIWKITNVYKSRENSIMYPPAASTTINSWLVFSNVVPEPFFFSLHHTHYFAANCRIISLNKNFNQL